MKNKHFQSFTTIVLIALTAAFCLPDSAQAGAIVTWGSDSGVVNNTPTGNDFTAIASGGNHGLALTADGSIVSWGKDSSHPLISNTPSESGFTAIAAGYNHSLAMRADGSFVSWGDDNYGQVSNAPTASGFLGIASGTGRHSLTLRNDGSIVSWGWDTDGQVSNTPTESGFTTIAAGEKHSLALTANGSIVTWGRDISGDLNTLPTGSGFTAIAAGDDHSLALTDNGSIVTWGRDTSAQVLDTPTESGFTTITAGEYHSLALTPDGSIVAWGYDGYGQVSGTPTGSGFIGIAAGNDHSIALTPEPCTLSLLVLGGLLLRRRKHGVMLVSCFLFFAVAGTSFAGEPRYLLTDIGTTSAGYAYGINDSRQVVGISGNHAFIWSDGILTDMGTTGGSASAAYGINNNGQVVGKSETGETQNGSVVKTAFLWEGGAYTELTPLQGQITSVGSGINADGLVVGHSRPAGIVGARACKWPGGALDPPGMSYSMAWGVSDTGDVVGEWDGLGVLWREDSMVHLGTLEGGWSIARDVNNIGQVVGESDGLAFLWQNESLSNLGLLPGHQHSEASAINDTGQIVGRSHASGWPDDHAVLWEDGQIQDLNTLIDADSGWFLAQARDINRHGDIVGWGYVDNEQRAFLLTVIPEPCTLSLLVLGGIVFCRQHRRIPQKCHG